MASARADSRRKAANEAPAACCSNAFYNNDVVYLSDDKRLVVPPPPRASAILLSSPWPFPRSSRTCKLPLCSPSPSPSSFPPIQQPPSASLPHSSPSISPFSVHSCVYIQSLYIKHSVSSTGRPSCKQSWCVRHARRHNAVNCFFSFSLCTYNYQQIFLCGLV